MLGHIKKKTRLLSAVNTATKPTSSNSGAAARVGVHLGPPQALSHCRHSMFSLLSSDYRGLDTWQIAASLDSGKTERFAVCPGLQNKTEGHVGAGT